jgi:hypothetical protein
MKNLEKTFLVIGLILVGYAIFSRFYGEPSIAAKQFRSISVLVLANTALILAVLSRGK